MQAHTRKQTGNTASSEISFSFGGRVYRLRLAENMARQAYDLLRHLDLNPAGKQSRAVDATSFAKEVAQAAGGPAPLALRVLRRRAGLTQAALAKLADMQAPHLSLMECGKRKVTPAKAKQLAAVLGCDWRRLRTGA